MELFRNLQAVTVGFLNVYLYSARVESGVIIVTMLSPHNGHLLSGVCMSCRIVDTQSGDDYSSPRIWYVNV